MKTIVIEDDEVCTTINLEQIIAFTIFKSEYDNELLIVTNSSDFYFKFSDKAKMNEIVDKLNELVRKR